MVDHTHAALHALIVGALLHVRKEVAASTAAVRLLDRHAQISIIAIYGETRAWRGVADDATIAIHDALQTLLGHDPMLDAPP